MGPTEPRFLLSPHLGVKGMDSGLPASRSSLWEITGYSLQFLQSTTQYIKIICLGFFSPPRPRCGHGWSRTSCHPLQAASARFSGHHSPHLWFKPQLAGRLRWETASYRRAEPFPARIAESPFWGTTKPLGLIAPFHGAKPTSPQLGACVPDKPGKGFSQPAALYERSPLTTRSPGSAVPGTALTRATGHVPRPRSQTAPWFPG